MYATIPDAKAAADGPEAPINLASLGRVRILRALTDKPVLSRAELVQRTGLARATVGSVIDDLIGAGLVRTTTEPLAPGARSGRPPQLLSLEARAGYAVGLDVGHDHVRVILTDLVGTSVWDSSVALSVDGDPRRTLDAAVELIDRAIGDTGVPRERVLGLGLGIACPVDAGGDLYTDGIMPGWTGVRPADELTDRTGLAVRIVNDANACVLAECRFGAAKDCADIIYLRLSAGIGASMVCDGRVVLGCGGFAGEIGHLTLDPRGAVCRCGNRGCLETVASPPAIAALLSRSWGRPVSTAELAELIGAGDRGALRAVGDAGDAVGRALTVAVMLLNPALIVVGGELIIAGESLFEPMRRILIRDGMRSHTRHLRIVSSALGDSAGVRGAAALVLDGVPERLGLEPPPSA